MDTLHISGMSLEQPAHKAAEALKKGGIVLYPTDTLYGLAIDATNPAALATLRELKGREKDKPISIVVPDIDAIETYAEFGPEARAIAERFLPGALTLVLKSKSTIPDELTKDGTIGIRIPDDPFCLALARAFGKPFTATSANRSGEETQETVEEILEQFGEKGSMISLAVDDGPRKGGIPSTIVSAEGGDTKVLREGAIPRGALGL